MKSRLGGWKLETFGFQVNVEKAKQTLLQKLINAPHLNDTDRWTS